MGREPILADLAIQIEDGKLEICNCIEEAEAISIIAKKAPMMIDKLKEFESRLSAIHNDILPEPDNVCEYQMLATAQAQTDELLNCDLRELSDGERVERINQYHRYTSIGSVLLNEHSNYGGKSKFFSVTWPNFKWKPYRFNDKASSGRAWGVNVLFEHSWYRGRRLWMIGLPYLKLPNFKDFGFNDKASSMISIP